MYIRNTFYVGPDFKVRFGNLRIKDRKVYPDGPCEKGDPVLDGSGLLCMGGMVNAHFHGLSTVSRGLWKDQALFDWYGDSAQGRFQKSVLEDFLENRASDEDKKAIALKEYAELARQGVTCVNDGGTIDGTKEIQKEALEEIGLRGTIDVLDQIGEYAGRGSELVSYGSHLLEEEDMTPDALRRIAELKKRNPDILFSTHCLETKARRDIVEKAFSKSSTEILEEYGCLDRKTILYHCVQADSNDLDRIARHGCGVVYNPVSNLSTGAGLLNISDFLDRGIPCMLGTDWADADYLGVLKTAYLLMKGQKGGEKHTAEDILKMASANGYRMLGPSGGGTVSCGAPADLVLVRLDSFRMEPAVHAEGFDSLIHNFVTCAAPEDIEHVFVNGRWIVKDRKLATADEDTIDRGWRNVMEKLKACLKSKPD
jgi:5-methylthioadenosine/S-adenosylhomocysteine deaminase